ncbi:hypothetical protein OSB04_012659, partial [Centaurea solstitialis]
MSPTNEMFESFKTCFFINDEERNFDPLIACYGGHEVITVEGLWNKISQSFGFPGCYGEAFNRLFIDHLLHPHEYFVFTQKWYGKYSSIESQKFGSVPDRTQVAKGCEENDDVGTSVGRSTRGNGQEDRNDIKASDQLNDSKVTEVEEAEEEDPSIEGYYSEENGNPSDGSGECEDFVVIVSQLASQAKRERRILNKEVKKISNYGIS